MKKTFISFHLNRATAVILFVFLAAMMVFPPVSLAADAPVLTSPSNGATGQSITGVILTWETYSDNTTYYKVDISTSSGFSSFFNEGDQFVDAPETTYTITKTMSENTKYYWRVTAISGSEASDTSEVRSFTTGSSSSTGGTTTTPDTASTTPATTGTTTTTTTGTTKDSEGGIMGFINEIGWPLTLAMVFVVVLFIVLLSILLTKPKKEPAGMGGRMPGGMGAQQQRFQQGSVPCPNCGFMNNSDRKFCANCGGAIGGQQYQAPPFQQHGTQYQQQQAYRPPQPPPPPPFQEQQFRQPPGGMQQQGVVCQTCGAPNAPGRQFCNNCGSQLPPPQFQQRAQQAPPQYQQLPVCPNCGAPMQPGQQFCGNCGYTVPGRGGQQQVIGTYQTFSCPICGANINRGMNPCPSCGTWLDWGR